MSPCCKVSSAVVMNYCKVSYTCQGRKWVSSGGPGRRTWACECRLQKSKTGTGKKDVFKLLTVVLPLLVRSR